MLFLTLLLVALSCGVHQGAARSPPRNNKAAENNKLMVLLIDGFRYDYFTDEMRGFPAMFETGVKADYLLSAFPTVSHVNYYTIMTGLHPESHGMVHNEMYDPEHDQYFWSGTNPGQIQPFWWEGGDPLWITASRQDKDSYMYYWVGCEVCLHELKPTFCETYVGRPPRENLTNAIDSGLRNLRDDGADFVGIYFGLTDTYGHDFGVGSDILLDTIEFVDTEIFNLQNELATTLMPDGVTFMSEVVNVVVVSDHGMATVGEPLIIDLLDYIDEDDVLRCLGGDTMPSIMFWPTPGREEAVYDALKGAHEHMSVYKKHEVPEEYHFSGHSRSPPITLVADEGWVIFRPGHTEMLQVGQHGYPNTVDDMRGIFVANGPDFKVNYESAGINNIDLYQMMSRVLHLNPSPHNGTWENIEDILVDPTPPSTAYGAVKDLPVIGDNERSCRWPPK